MDKWIIRRMDKWIILLLILTLLIGCSNTQENASPDARDLPSATAAPPTIDDRLNVIPALEAAGNTFDIKISGFAFNPAELTINKGDSVSWKNLDTAPHLVLSDTGNEIASQELPLNGVYTNRFDTSDTFEYYCSIHPSMKGKIQVR